MKKNNNFSKYFGFSSIDPFFSSMFSNFVRTTFRLIGLTLLVHILLHCLLQTEKTSISCCYCVSALDILRRVRFIFRFLLLLLFLDLCYHLQNIKSISCIKFSFFFLAYHVCVITFHLFPLNCS